MYSIGMPSMHAYGDERGVEVDLIPNRIFVGGFAPHITEKQLRDVFIKHGTVTEVKIMRCNDNNVSKGYGFVTFETEEEALRVRMSPQSYEIDGRRLNVGPAMKRVWEHVNVKDNYVPVPLENAQSYAWPNVFIGGVWAHPLPMQVYVLPDGARVFVPPNYGGPTPHYASMYCAERLPPGMCPIQFLTTPTVYQLTSQRSLSEQSCDERTGQSQQHDNRM